MCLQLTHKGHFTLHVDRIFKSAWNHFNVLMRLKYIFGKLGKKGFNKQCYPAKL